MTTIPRQHAPSRKLRRERPPALALVQPLYAQNSHSIIYPTAEASSGHAAIATSPLATDAHTPRYTVRSRSAAGRAFSARRAVHAVRKAGKGVAAAIQSALSLHKDCASVVPAPVNQPTITIGKAPIEKTPEMLLWKSQSFCSVVPPIYSPSSTLSMTSTEESLYSSYSFSSTIESEEAVLTPISAASDSSIASSLFVFPMPHTHLASQACVSSYQSDQSVPVILTPTVVPSIQYSDADEERLIILQAKVARHRRVGSAPLSPLPPTDSRQNSIAHSNRLSNGRCLSIFIFGSDISPGYDGEHAATGDAVSDRLEALALQRSMTRRALSKSSSPRRHQRSQSLPSIVPLRNPTYFFHMTCAETPGTPSACRSIARLSLARRQPHKSLSPVARRAETTPTLHLHATKNSKMGNFACLPLPPTPATALPLSLYSPLLSPVSASSTWTHHHAYNDVTLEGPGDSFEMEMFKMQHFRAGSLTPAAKELAARRRRPSQMR
ncbi:hypothetical protein THASP1DRAFT_32276 [Thamnocephalis sphaerospora]|uniref:Uncharacterized protein n=1 Tax=Thamnocephalis sphaerospora TaxID=78915 RepID=A0A4P9XKE9_9FUNG|nr:hypothetical protein THASP1DRAFT_32276 [Thamnocephalis sphaerospora]|eukprot:RKP05891.1 hypothetical protein THASP1DRAFT_32276 [Thamnocephalis sphaerospora]